MAFPKSRKFSSTDFLKEFAMKKILSSKILKLCCQNTQNFDQYLNFCTANINFYKRSISVCISF